MEYGVQLVKPFSPRRLSGYFNTFAQKTHTMQGSSTWTTTLTCLKSQKGYLEDLLSKTATTLNALRDKQGSNDRRLSTRLGPCSKKKKILQNRWRTAKTIKTCENEEKAILNCLQVCENNIHTLESMVYLMGTRTTVAEYNSSNSNWSYTDSAMAEFDWDGWADEGHMSPFHRQSQRQHALLMLDGIPPEAPVHGPKRPPMLRPRVHAPPSAKLPPVPPNTALPQRHHSLLSPEATSFEPHMTHSPTLERRQKELDKLSISGLLASKRMFQILERRCSDASIRHMLQRLSIESWGTDSRQHDANVSSAATAAPMKRTRSA
jgi:hypothetical protein